MDTNIPVDPNLYVQRLEQQCAAMNRQIILQDIAIEELTKKIRELEQGRIATNGGESARSGDAAVAGN